MEFSKFKNRIAKVKKIEITTDHPHLEMIPETRKKEVKDTAFRRPDAQNAGVVALFYPGQKNETMIMLILRKTYKGVHSGQIGFPGGRVEVRDKDILDTALRETYEEIGVHASNITILKELTKVYIPPSNFWVYPFLGVCKSKPMFKRQESEVEELLPVCLEDLMDINNMGNQTISTSYAKNISVPAFTFKDKIVWGATGMMLNEVKSLVSQVI